MRDEDSTAFFSLSSPSPVLFFFTYLRQTWRCLLRRARKRERERENTRAPSWREEEKERDSPFACSAALLGTTSILPKGRDFFSFTFSSFFTRSMQPCPSSLLPPKKRHQAELDKDLAPVPSEGDKATCEGERKGQPLTTLAKPEEAIAIDSVAEVETSKIRGSAPPRRPRVGEQYQAELPQLLERPRKQ